MFEGIKKWWKDSDAEFGADLQVDTRLKGELGQKEAKECYEKGGRFWAFIPRVFFKFKFW